MKYVVGYSGGADSQVALDLALQAYDDVEIVFCNTTLEFPETLKTISETARYYGLEIKFLHPTKSFDEYLADFGGMYPSWRRRWCTERLKERPLRRYISSLCKSCLRRDERVSASSSAAKTPRSELVTVIDGIRKDESRARAKRQPLEIHKRGGWQIEHTIFNWSRENVFEHIRIHDLPLNPLYEMGYKRVSCWFCPFTPKADNMILKVKHPKLYAQAERWAERWGKRFCYPVEDCEKP
jgi:phosphoadenosine phosphosulfate reductase